jgi:hypothetical protein
MDVRLHTIFAEAATDKIMKKHLQQKLGFSPELASTWTKHFNGNLAGLRDMLTSAGHAAAVHGFCLSVQIVVRLCVAVGVVLLFGQSLLGLSGAGGGQKASDNALSRALKAAIEASRERQAEKESTFLGEYEGGAKTLALEQLLLLQHSEGVPSVKESTTQQQHTHNKHTHNTHTHTPANAPGVPAIRKALKTSLVDHRHESSIILAVCLFDVGTLIVTSPTQSSARSQQG